MKVSFPGLFLRLGYEFVMIKKQNIQTAFLFS